MNINYRKEIIIDQRSNTPITEQIYSQLEKLISSTRMIDGDPLISETELATVCRVDTSDVITAFKLLEKRAFILYDNSGIPIVSKQDRIINFLSEISSIEDEIRLLNKVATCDILEYKIIEIKSSDLIKLSNYEDKRFLKIKKLYKGDGEPFVVLEEFFPVETFPELLEAKVYEPHRINEIIETSGMKSTFNKRIISVHIMDLELANLLDDQNGNAGFKAELVFYNQFKKPFGYGVTYVPSRFHFTYTVDL